MLRCECACLCLPRSVSFKCMPTNAISPNFKIGLKVSGNGRCRKIGGRGSYLEEIWTASRGKDAGVSRYAVGYHYDIEPLQLRNTITRDSLWQLTAGFSLFLNRYAGLLRMPFRQSCATRPRTYSFSPPTRDCVLQPLKPTRADIESGSTSWKTQPKGPVLAFLPIISVLVMTKEHTGHLQYEYLPILRDTPRTLPIMLITPIFRAHHLSFSSFEYRTSRGI